MPSRPKAARYTLGVVNILTQPPMSHMNILTMYLAVNTYKHDNLYSWDCQIVGLTATTNLLPARLFCVHSRMH